MFTVHVSLELTSPNPKNMNKKFMQIESQNVPPTHLSQYSLLKIQATMFECALYTVSSKSTYEVF